MTHKTQKQYRLAELMLIAIIISLALFAQTSQAEDAIISIGNNEVGGDHGGTYTDTSVFDDGSTLSVTYSDNGTIVGITSTPAPSGSADGGGGKIICTELFHQGYLAEHIFKADQAFGVELRNTDPLVYLGYVTWAIYIVQGMKRSPLFTRIVSLFAIPWAHHMAYTQGVEKRNNYLGLLFMRVGTVFCRLVGYTVYFRSLLGVRI